MNPRDLVQAVLCGEDLVARQWLKDAKRAGVDLSALQQPTGLSSDQLVVAAGLTELFAERAGKQPPPWTKDVGSASKQLFLVKSAEKSPALRRMCERGTPACLRRRNLVAVRDYLDFV